MVIPSIRIVIHDDHGRAAPGGLLLQEIDEIDQKGLLIQRVRISRMTVLIRRGLDEAHRWKIALRYGGKEILHVVLVVRGLGRHAVGLDAAAYGRERARAHVLRVRRRRVVLERLVVRDVVRRCAAPGRRLRRAAVAAGGAVRVRGGEVEATVEPAPGDLLPVEQVADVLADEQVLVSGRRARVAVRIGVADERPVARTDVGPPIRLQWKQAGPGGTS